MGADAPGQGRGRARARGEAVVRRLPLQLPAVPVHPRPHHLHAAPDAAGREPGVRLRQVQGEAARGRHAEDHLRRRRRVRRGQAGARGDHRFPQGPAEVPAPGWPAAEGCAARRAARNGQDAPRQSRGGRGGTAVLLDVGIRFRGDVRRRRRLAGARSVRAGQGARAVHHLHRRNRRRRAPPRSGAGRRSSSRWTGSSRTTG